jgi:acetyl-CoA acetyltransferase
MTVDESTPGVVDDLRADNDMRGRAAIVGIGVTDFGADYAASRADRSRPPRDVTNVAKLAFDRALADAGIGREEVDGLAARLLHIGPGPRELAGILGVKPRYFMEGGGLHPIPRAVRALAAGECDTIALSYAAVSRTSGRQFGGQTYGGDGRDSYYYYHPWGFSAQAAHWALMFRHYMTAYGATEEDLGSVAIALRRYAMMNENATMRSPLTLDDYLAARYIVRPLRLFDMCLVNDGGVCLILRRADAAKDGPHTPVLVQGWGYAEVKYSKMHYMVEERLRPQMQQAVSEALAMARTDLSEVGHFQAYDASSVHLVNQLEGYGFVKPGEGLDFVRDGGIALGGSLPVNTNGGMLSEAYMHGWNQLIECVRQLRHEAGERQVRDVHTSMFSFATTDSAQPVIFGRAEED